MEQKLRKRFIDGITHEIIRLNGPEFESFASFAIEHLLPDVSSEDPHPHSGPDTIGFLN